VYFEIQIHNFPQTFIQYIYRLAGRKVVAIDANLKVLCCDQDSTVNTKYYSLKEINGQN
jgi:hypothetical protein